MRPLMTSSTSSKNDGAAVVQSPSHRKTHINQKEIQSENLKYIKQKQQNSNKFEPLHHFNKNQLITQQQQQQQQQQQPQLEQSIISKTSSDINLSSFSIINEHSNHLNIENNSDKKLINQNFDTTSDELLLSSSSDISINNKLINTHNNNNNNYNYNSGSNSKNKNSKRLSGGLCSSRNSIEYNDIFHNKVIEKFHLSNNSVGNFYNFDDSGSSSGSSKIELYGENNISGINKDLVNIKTNYEVNNETYSNLPESEPLLDYNLEYRDPKNSIYLKKNSASLIFTKKDLINPTAAATTTTTATTNNICCTNNHNSNIHNNHPNNYYIHRSKSSGAKLKIKNKGNSTKSLSNKIIKNQNSSINNDVDNDVVVDDNDDDDDDDDDDNDYDIVNFCGELNKHRRSLQLNYLNNIEQEDYINNYFNSTNKSTTTATTTNRKQLAYSWYAPVYSALEEEIEQDSRESSPAHNLANIRNTNSTKISNQQNRQQQYHITSAKSLDENEKLLENKNQVNIQPQLQQQSRLRRLQQQQQQQNFPHSNNSQNNIKSPSNLQLTLTQQQADHEGPQTTSLLPGGPIPRRKRFENFLKTLVGRKPSKDNVTVVLNQQQLSSNPTLLPSPDITVTKSPSDHSLLRDFSSRLSFNNGNPTSDSYYEKITNSTLSLNTVQQKLWNVVPLLRRENSALSLHNEKSNSIVQYTGLRKCETVLALSRQSAGSGYMNTTTTFNNNLINNSSNNKCNNNGNSDTTNSALCSNGVSGPIKPQNRLRNSISTMNATCSRCSSLLSLTASGSRYSLNVGNNGGLTSTTHNTNNNNKNNSNSKNGNNSKINSNNNSSDSNATINFNKFRYSDSDRNLPSFILGDKLITSSDYTDGSYNDDDKNSGNISPPLSSTDESTTLTLNSTITQLQQQSEQFIIFVCKLCLSEVISSNEATTIIQCGCKFCTECMKSYVEFEISEGAYEISCPDAQCPIQGIISITEISELVSSQLMQKHHRYRLNREIELDKARTWCPKAGCETICLIGSPNRQHASSGLDDSSPTAIITSADNAKMVTIVDDKTISVPTCGVLCPTCREEFCSSCKKPWHPTVSCEEHSRRLVADGQEDGIGIPFDNELIKCCPMCAVPIEKDEGCAQMMCKRCKHVFCWYCLASLDDDFLLRHYDKGPCKNKLGHSRASVVWHRAQVIGIFAGFGILLLVASPLLLLAAPCIICCKCRVCSSSTKLDDPDTEFDEGVALQR